MNIFNVPGTAVGSGDGKTDASDTVSALKLVINWGDIVNRFFYSSVIRAQ